LEYICVPFDYYALVLGRSSWGRLGLNIATATTVHAGFRGCITLELRNLGETPLPLKVGLRIAQLCLIPVPEAAVSSHVGYFATLSKYIGPVAPEIPKIKDDADWELLKSLGR
jgi:dCTP deaminase